MYDTLYLCEDGFPDTKANIVDEFDDCFIIKLRNNYFKLPKQGLLYIFNENTYYGSIHNIS